jgi:hypothetical protein
MYAAATNTNVINIYEENDIQKCASASVQYTCLYCCCTGNLRMHRCNLERSHLEHFDVVGDVLPVGVSVEIKMWELAFAHKLLALRLEIVLGLGLVIGLRLVTTLHQT